MTVNREIAIQIVGNDIFIHLRRGISGKWDIFEVKSAKEAVDEVKKYHQALKYPSTISVYTGEGKTFLDVLDDADVVAFLLRYSK
jgi:hypothetical protein